ncbi:MAG: hypothetical protein USCAAHI_01160 [Beijerinckiaceae bacterium]|nr:MAG: hypothetical protein USCAAHI_01160 [Beijerinckiaceae bacterium]
MGVLRRVCRLSTRTVSTAALVQLGSMALTSSSAVVWSSFQSRAQLFIEQCVHLIIGKVPVGGFYPTQPIGAFCLIPNDPIVDDFRSSPFVSIRATAHRP